MALAILPQPSATVQVFVTVRSQPLPIISAPMTPVAVNPTEQLSITEAEPNAALSCAVVGLQFIAAAGEILITGFVVSRV